MTHRLEQQAKRALLLALSVLLSALAFNINTGENKMDPTVYSGSLMYDTTVTDGSNPIKQVNVAPDGSMTYSPYTIDAPAPDPYAQWGGYDNYTNLRNTYNNQKNTITGSASDAAVSAGTNFRQSIDRWGLNQKQAQGALDNRGINAEMAKSQGAKGVLGMVGRGVRSAGVMLANRNAGDSSAAGAIANAYGNIGSRQMAGVNNAYGLEQNQIGLDQANLEAGQSLDLKEFEDNKQSVVNNIVRDAENQLAALDAQIAGASLPDRIDIEREKQAIRNNAMAQLSQYDSRLAEANAGSQAKSADARREEARRLSDIGVASNMDFGYTTDVPAQFQGTGPYASELPIFTYGRNKKTA